MTQHLTWNSQIATWLEDPYTILNFSGNSSPETQTPSHLPTPAPMSTACQSAHPSVHLNPSMPIQEMTKHLMILQTWLQLKMKQTLKDLSWQLTNSSSLAPPHPSPSSGNPIHSMVPIPRNSVLSFFSASWIFGTAKTSSALKKTRSTTPFPIWRESHWIVSNLYFWACMTPFGSQILISSSWNLKTTLDLS